MRTRHIRGVAALALMAVVVVLLWRNPAISTAGGSSRLYLPFTMADAPAQLNPDFQNYLGVGISDADGDSEIYTVRGDSSELSQLTHNSVSDHSPTFSPNGAQIAFVRMVAVEGTEEFRYQVLLINRDGSNEHVLWEYQMPERRVLLDWSSRGQHILVSAESSPYQAWVVGVDGSVLPLEATPLQLHFPHWSPDGRYISYRAFITGSYKTPLYVMNVATGVDGLIGENVQRMWWSPDSRDMLISDYGSGSEQIFLIQPDGSNERELVVNNRFLLHGWMEDGEHILAEIEGDAGENFYKISRNGGDPVPLTTYPNSQLNGYMDATRSGMFYSEHILSQPDYRVYWLPFDSGIPRYLTTITYGINLGTPTLSYDQDTILYTLSECGDRFCESARYRVALDDPTAIPQLIPNAVEGYLPLSSTRAATQVPANFPPQLYTIQMVELEPTVVIRPLDFTAARDVRAMAEWRYLP